MLRLEGWEATNERFVEWQRERLRLSQANLPALMPSIISFLRAVSISCVEISNVDTLHSYRHKVPISDQANRKRVDLSSPFYVEIICDLLLRQLIQSKYHPNKLPPLSFFIALLPWRDLQTSLSLYLFPLDLLRLGVTLTSMQTKSQNRGQPFCTLDGAESHYHSTSCTTAGRSTT